MPNQRFLTAAAARSVPPDKVVRVAARRLAETLVPRAVTVAVMAEGHIQAHIAGDYPMVQKLAIRLYAGRWFWCWVWSGTEEGAPSQMEAMVDVGEYEEAARRIANVLSPRPGPVNAPAAD